MSKTARPLRSAPRFGAALTALALFGGSLVGCARDGVDGPATQELARRRRADAGAIASDAGPEPAPSAAVCCDSTSLGALPGDLSGLRWPALPSTNRTVTVSTDDALRAALRDRARTRVVVEGEHLGDYRVERSDLEIQLGATASIQTLTIARSQRRVRVHGGRFELIQIEPPIDFPNGATTPESRFLVTDVRLDCVTIDSPDTGLLVRGQRVAIVGADVSAERYALYAGVTAPLQSTDLIVAHSVLRSAGPEATFRIHDVLRSAVAFTTFVNPFKHDYRVHGVSSRNYVGDSYLVGTGAMLGWEPGDVLDRQHYVRNTLWYAATNGPFLVEPTRVSRLTVTDSVAYSSVAAFPTRERSDWTIARNETRPYEPAPASVYSCR